MFRRLALLLVLALAISPLGRPAATAQVARGKILGRALVARKGLERAWHTQVDLDAARDRMSYVLLDQDWLFVQSERGLVQVLDAETGVTIWSEMIGEPDYPTLPLAANDRFVVVINGSTLYLLDRSNGRAARIKQMRDSVPNAAPALSPGRIYVPTMRGLIESWQLPLDEATSTELERERQRTQTVWRIHSAGRSTTQLLATDNSMFWPTDTGYVYAAELDARKVRYRVELTDRIVAPLGYRQPILVAGSLGGFVWAVEEAEGDVLWRFSTGHPIRTGPTIVGDCIFVCPERHGMFCLDATKGDQHWWSPDATRLVAKSATRVYASDRSNRLLILDAKTGYRQGTLATEALTLQLVNAQTDRIYLGTPDGLIQCLHEQTQKEPLYHQPPPPAAEGGDAPPTADAPGDESAPVRLPFGAEGDDGAPATDTPPPADAPADESPPVRLPFGDES
jgi:outer membrane protein assembly factor BamB